MLAQSPQLSLFELKPTVRPDVPKGATIQERFQAFHEQNPQVYAALRDLCLDRKRRGFRHWSIKCAWEILRWLGEMHTDGEDFLLPNDYHSRYARLLMEREPELDGFFTTRELRAA